MQFEHIRPDEIEARSFEILSSILGERHFDKEQEHVIKRCIHTSADFDYADNLYFSMDATIKLKAALKAGCMIITDTNMALAGVNKRLASKYGIETACFMADPAVAEQAIAQERTRAYTAVQKALSIGKPLVYAVGNAPTALIGLHEALQTAVGAVIAGIIAAPVGFVNVVESKELIMTNSVPMIVAKGRKGGSNIAAAICNALLMDIK
ncbi:MAG: precorrin-8X methylmutase [Deferribacteraceae bacterium]|nr:precorrin-8X methylmutase [Deferribacteraceae bacterium]